MVPKQVFTGGGALLVGLKNIDLQNSFLGVPWYKYEYLVEKILSWLTQVKSTFFVGHHVLFGPSSLFHFFIFG